MYKNKDGVTVIGAEGPNHDALLTKIANVRDGLFKYEEIIESGMMWSADYVIDEMVKEIKRLRERYE